VLIAWPYTTLMKQFTFSLTHWYCQRMCKNNFMYSSRAYSFDFEWKDFNARMCDLPRSSIYFCNSDLYFFHANFFFASTHSLQIYYFFQEVFERNWRKNAKIEILINFSPINCFERYVFMILFYTALSMLIEYSSQTTFCI
jgi:hypothetical protein